MWCSQVFSPARALLVLIPTSARAYTTLSDASLKSIIIPQGTFDIHDSSLLSPILIPRVSGSEGNRKVQQYFTDFFAQKLPDWHVSTQNSTSKTPVTGDKDIPFTNIIATRDPPWTSPGDVSYLTLAAHFDSKYSPTGFVGATDSAAPCAMLLHVAQALDKALARKWAKMEADGVDEFDEQSNKGVQILLLDGEESFLRWTHEDSLYGARALAESWEAEISAMNTYQTKLDSISLFVLLDLLGAAQPASSVPSYFRTTHWAYQHLAKVEERLRGLGNWKSTSDQIFLPDKNKPTDQRERWLGGFVEDDHLPFMARGVEVLHLIPSPFPRVWHTMDDDGEHLDIPTVEDWTRLTTAFTAEWMELESFLESTSEKRSEKTEL